MKEDDRVFPIFVLPPNHFDKVAVTFYHMLYWAVLPPNFVAKVANTSSDNVTELLPCCWAWHREMTNYCIGHGTER